MPKGVYIRKRKSVLERFWSKVKIMESGCWEWQAGLTKAGYGEFQLNGTMVKSHRFAYKLLKGEIPEDMVIDHLCRNRRCVNPEHLEVVTMKVNTIRGIGPSSKCARLTHCPKGHPYDLLNTYIYADGSRRCRACRREQEQKRRNKRYEFELQEAK